jgi:hypothetical protein
MRKQADFHMVFHYKRVYRTFEGGKAKEIQDFTVCASSYG